ncbi:MAG: heat shock protein HspQ [Caulobacteraceae bacterium]
MITRVSPSAGTQAESSSPPHPDFVVQLIDEPAASPIRLAKFGLGQVVKHRVFSFRGVIFDVDPTFANTEEWWQAIPAEVRPRKDQPFYHLLADGDEGGYVAYVSEQNLLADTSGEPIGNPSTSLIFEGFQSGRYRLRPRVTH